MSLPDVQEGRWKKPMAIHIPAIRVEKAILNRDSGEMWIRKQYAPAPTGHRRAIRPQTIIVRIVRAIEEYVERLWTT